MKNCKNKEHEKILTLLEKETYIRLKFNKKIETLKRRIMTDTDINLLFNFSSCIALKNLLKNFYKTCHNIMKKSKYYDKVKVLRAELKNRPKQLNDNINRKFYRYKIKLLDETLNSLAKDGWSINDIYCACFNDYKSSFEK